MTIKKKTDFIYQVNKNIKRGKNSLANILSSDDIEGNEEIKVFFAITRNLSCKGFCISSIIFEEYQFIKEIHSIDFRLAKLGNIESSLEFYKLLESFKFVKNGNSHQTTDY